MSSAATQIALTLVIFTVTVFALGFVADPIINLYLDPLGTVTSGYSSDPYDDYMYYDGEDAGWAEHFAKGFASLGLVGFVKVLFAMGPWNYLNMRQFMGSGSGRTGNSGRDRVASISWIVVVLGVVTFLYVSQGRHVCAIT